MQVNTDFEGRVFAPSPPYLVGREAIREFASAVGAASPLHHDLDAARAAGHADLVAPPTYAVVIAQKCEAQYVAAPESGIDFSRVVHAEERFEHVRPLVAGDEVVATLTVQKARMLRGNGVVTTSCALAVDGVTVSTVTSTLFVRAGEEA